MIEKERENRAKGHLLSTQILTLLRREHNPSKATATLRAAILRIALRQEIFIRDILLIIVGLIGVLKKGLMIGCGRFG
jgi:hypothetical protein